MSRPICTARTSANPSPPAFCAAVRPATSTSPSRNVPTGAPEMSIRGLGEIAERVRCSSFLLQTGGRGSGSGVVWSDDGLIMTNAHVARGPRAKISLWDGREFQAEVTARDSRRDLAALRISAIDLPAANSRDSSEVRAGEIALAVGNPFGFLGAPPTGIVHAVRPLPALRSPPRGH